MASQKSFQNLSPQLVRSTWLLANGQLSSLMSTDASVQCTLLQTRASPFLSPWYLSLFVFGWYVELQLKNTDGKVFDCFRLSCSVGWRRSNFCLINMNAEHHFSKKQTIWLNYKNLYLLMSLSGKYQEDPCTGKKLWLHMKLSTQNCLYEIVWKPLFVFVVFFFVVDIELFVYACQ